MSIEQDQQWITGEEYGRERRRLLKLGVPDDAPEFQELHRRITARNDYLYERYGKRYRETHEGKWIAISQTGEVLIRDTAGEVMWAATDAWGPGHAAVRKLAEFPGHVLRFG
jgi:hypothetical protein